jgi:hypothetical protein
MSDSTLSRRSAALYEPNSSNKLPTENSEEPNFLTGFFSSQGESRRVFDQLFISITCGDCNDIRATDPPYLVRYSIVRDAASRSGRA